MSSIRTFQAPSVLTRPWIRFGREICGDLPSALRREWLVSNGIGGYSSSTLAGINTRRYHGLLVSALAPPVQRTVLVAGIVEHAHYAGRTFPLFTLEYGDGTIDGHGYRHLEAFHLDGTLPLWRFAIADALIERRLWMVYGENTTVLSYHLERASGAVELDLTPLITYRDFHALSSGADWAPAIEPRATGFLVHAFPDAAPFRVEVSSGEFRPDGKWYWNFLHREETARGMDDRADLFAPGTFRVSLNAGEQVQIILTTFKGSGRPDPGSLDAERARQSDILAHAGVADAEPTVQQLTLAADQFVVRRAGEDNLAGKTVIAGYHWFNDWGRDTMISLPGLTMATGRANEAADILRTFARYVVDGLLPNNFADQSGAIPGYNTADATLWYVLAVRAYHKVTGDTALVAELLPTLDDIAAHHIGGTRFGIGVDPSDGLLRAGEEGWQITWMDAKIGEWVVTPRIGKPVEINALWYNTLRTLAEFHHASDPQRAVSYDQRADSVREAFRERFRGSDAHWLADVVDGPSGDDWTLRPNQILALSLPFSLLEGEEARAVVEAVGQSLLTSFGLRSLDPNHPDYRGAYAGDAVQRDSGYHQGPVWTWLAGPFAEAHYRAWGDPASALAWLRPFSDHLFDAGLGSVSEILDGDAPHLPRGCIAQAWGVAETLRVWRLLSELDGTVDPISSG